MMSATASGATACASRSGVRYGWVLAVSSCCGATALTRIPSGRSSRSSTRVRWTRAALLTAEVAIPAVGSRPGRAATCTMEPEPRSRRYGTTATGVPSAFQGVPAVDVCGLPDDAAWQLLRSVAGTPLEPAVVDRVVADTGGNPLALVEV